MRCALCQTEALKTCLKPDDAPLRWVSMADTCMRIIDHWYALQQLYVSAGEVFPLESKQAEFLELSSLLEPVASIMRDVQNSDHPMSGQMQLALAKLKRTTLCRTRPLKVHCAFKYTCRLLKCIYTGVKPNGVQPLETHCLSLL